MMLIAARRLPPIAPVLLSLCLAACAGDDVRGSAGATAAAPESQLPAAVAPEGAVPMDTVRAPAGTWSLGLAENKLRSAQLDPVRQAADVRRAGLGVPGTRYALGAAQLEIFLYADAIARGRDTDVLDPARLAAGRSAAPTLIADGNLAALLFATDASLVARVRAALRTEADDGPLEPAGTVPPRGASGRAP